MARSQGRRMARAHVAEERAAWELTPAPWAATCEPAECAGAGAPRLHDHPARQLLLAELHRLRVALGDRLFHFADGAHTARLEVDLLKVVRLIVALGVKVHLQPDRCGHRANLRRELVVVLQVGEVGGGEALPTCALTARSAQADVQAKAAR
eukprot:6010339-Prymnesium_polylepis.1